MTKFSGIITKYINMKLMTETYTQFTCTQQKIRSMTCYTWNRQIFAFNYAYI